MNKLEIKAKVLDYQVVYHGFSCGQAKLELLEGQNKGQIITIQIYTKHCKKDEVITIYEESG